MCWAADALARDESQAISKLFRRSEPFNYPESRPVITAYIHTRHYLERVSSKVITSKIEPRRTTKRNSNRKKNGRIFGFLPAATQLLIGKLFHSHDVIWTEGRGDEGEREKEKLRKNIDRAFKERYLYRRLPFFRRRHDKRKIRTNIKRGAAKDDNFLVIVVVVVAKAEIGFLS